MVVVGRIDKRNIGVCGTRGRLDRGCLKKFSLYVYVVRGKISKRDRIVTRILFPVSRMVSSFYDRGQMKRSEKNVERGVVTDTLVGVPKSK